MSGDSKPTFDDLEKILRSGGTWADIVNKHGRPAKVCKKHKHVWCFYCPESEHT